MPTKTGPHLELGIAHVLFVDVVGYSKLLIDEQRTLLEELNHIIRSTAECYGLANFCALWDKYRVLITPDVRACVFKASSQLRALRDRRLRRCLSSDRRCRNVQVARSVAVCPLLDPSFRRTAARCRIRLGCARARPACQPKSRRC